MKNNKKIKKTKLANSILGGGGIKNKNAFTLIELLAIIVILAIIAVITVPIILNVIDNAKKGSIKDSAYGYKDAVNKYYVSELYENENIKLNGTYLVENDGTMQGMDLTSNSYTDKLDISVSGTTPTGGYLNYEKSILKDGCLTMDEYKVTIENGEVTKTEKGSCESVSLTACDSPNFKPSPEEWFTFDASTNTITAFSDVWDGTTDITIPCQIDGVDVVNIGNDTDYTAAFEGKRLTSIVIPDSVVNIGKIAFTSNNIKKIVFGNNIENIGEIAFQWNELEEIELPNSIKNINNNAFYENNIKYLKIGENVKKIGTNAFFHNQIKKIDLSNVEEIGSNCFVGNQLEEIVIPNSVKKVGESAFASNTLRKVEIKGKDITLDRCVFCGNYLLEMVYNDTGTSFDWGYIITGQTGDIFETGKVVYSPYNVEIKKSN